MWKTLTDSILFSVQHSQAVCVCVCFNVHTYKCRNCILKPLDKVTMRSFLYVFSWNWKMNNINNTKPSSLSSRREEGKQTKNKRRPRSPTHTNRQTLTPYVNSEFRRTNACNEPLDRERNKCAVARRRQESYSLWLKLLFCNKSKQPTR